MKKILSLLVLVCLSCMGAWAQISNIVTSTIEAPKPLYMYVDNQEVCYVTTGLKIFGSSGASGEAKGKFILIATATQGEYNIYETTTQKYVAMKSGATTNMKSGTEMVDTPNENCVWVIARYGNQAAWSIKPKSLGAYMNYNGGPNGNKGGQTIGFWTNGSSDSGSRWYFERADGNEIRFVTIETAATNRGQYIFNDIRLTEVGLFTYQNCSNASHTTHPVPAFSTDNSCYVWRINDQYGTTYSEIMNGAGYTIKGTDAEHSTLYPRTGTIDGYDYFKFDLTGTGCLNASDHNGFSRNYLDAVTNWNTSDGPSANDNHWKVQDVDLTGKTIYNIVVNGAPAGTHPYVSYNEQYAGTGGFFIASSAVAQNQLTASALSGYKEPVINVAGTTITVTYEPDDYPVAFDRNTTYTGNDLAWQRAIKSITIGGVTKNVAEYAEDASSKTYNAYRDLTEDCVFAIAASEALNAKITIGSTDNKSWSDAYIYVDADDNKQFTTADPDELFASLTGGGSVTNFNNPFTGHQVAPATEGTYRVRIVLGAQEPAGNATFTNNSNRIVDVTLKVVDVAGLQNKIDEVVNAIDADAVGYPDRHNNANTSEITNLNQFRSYSATLKPVTAENYGEALAALAAVYPLTAVNLPKDGKAYYFVNVAAGDGTMNGTQRYLNYNESNANLSAEVYTEGTTVIPESSIFVCKDRGEGATGGRFVFVNNQGHYLRYYGQSNGNSRKGALSETFSEADASVNIVKLEKSGSYMTQANSVADVFGLCAITGKRADKNHYNAGIIVSSSGSFDGVDIPNFVNNGYSTAFRIEEASFPYTTKTLNDGGDGKKYATVALPYAMEIPAGVKAYAATENGDVLTLTDATESSQNVAKGAYILVSESATSAAVLPAAANPVAVDNDLRGSITTAPSGSIYVLNKTAEEGVGFYKFNGENNTLLGKAYLPSDAAANKLAFRFEDVLTAISAIEGNGKNVEIFDLQGRRLNKAQKGMNIINGHKVLVK